MAEGDLKLFAYEAVSSSTGERVKAKMQAPTASAVTSALKADGWVPVVINESSNRGLNFDLGDLTKNRPLKMKHTELAAFSRQMHQLLRAGVSIPKTILALGEEADPKVTAMCSDVADRTSSGVPLSVAMSAYPAAFDDVFCSYLGAGEQAGTLVSSTKRLATMLEKRSSFALKVKSVTAYPKMVTYAMSLIVLGIMMFMVPSYAKIYDSFGAKLPRPTEILVTMSSLIPPIRLTKVPGFPFFTRSSGQPIWISPLNFLSPALWGFGIRFGVKRWLRATKDDLDVGERLDRIKFRMPVFGQLNKKTSLWRWASTLAGALSAGVQTYIALDLAARASGSRWITKTNIDLTDAVRSGRQLSSEMSKHSDLFPPNIRSMISTGEQSGEIDEMLDSVAIALDDEIDAIIAGLSARIEVVLLMVMGVVVGGLLAVLYMPILGLTTTASDGLSGGKF